MKDTAESSFSQIPGFGTILEIGLCKTHRNRGIGKDMVAHAERHMTAGGVDGLYVSAYGPAQGFWKNAATGTRAKQPPMVCRYSSKRFQILKIATSVFTCADRMFPYRCNTQRNPAQCLLYV
jgi:ribosomal protein S18 acetylase RimI-like enzyme